MSDGTAAGTQEITGIAGASTGANPDGSTGLNPTGLTVFNGEALFAGWDSGGNYGLWVTNGTAAGTSELTGIAGQLTGANPNTNIPGFDPSGFLVYNGEVLFAGTDSSGNGPGLWVTNGTAAGLTRSPAPAVSVPATSPFTRARCCLPPTVPMAAWASG